VIYFFLTLATLTIKNTIIIVLKLITNIMTHYQRTFLKRLYQSYIITLDKRIRIQFGISFI